MKRTMLIIVAACVLALALGLAGCGGPGSSNSFKGFAPRAAEDLGMLMADASTLATERRDATSASAVESDMNAELADEFARGNAAYRAQDYEAAEESYQKVIEQYAMHYGANVNLALAQLGQEKNEDALVQALACIELFPDDPAMLLNAQVAATACGFGDSDIARALELVVTGAGAGPLEAKTNDAQYGDSYEYNSLWNRVETELHQALNPQPASSSSSSDAAAEATETPASPDEVYHRLQEQIRALYEKDGSDDVGQLDVYLQAVGVDLGFEGSVEASAADEDEGVAAAESSSAAESASESSSAAAATARFPITAVDDSFFKFEITDIGPDDTTGQQLLKYTFTNKSDKTLYLHANDGDWAVNGKSGCYCVGESSGVPARGSLSADFHFTDKSKDEITDELKSFKGIIYVSETEDGDRKDSWEISWSADQP